MKAKTNEQIAVSVSLVSIAVNAVLTVFKLIAGFFGNSGAMISDAVHSASDILSTVVVIVGVKFANRDSDTDHQYGHERFEPVAAIILSIMLAVTGIGIGYSGVMKIINSSPAQLEIPTNIALVAAVASIVVKEVMYWFTRSAAKQTNSGALMADAWHHRSDALSSVGSFVGILGAQMGFPVLDPLASVVICGFIVKTALDIFFDAINKMTDKACDTDISENMLKLIAKQPEVIKVDQLKTRLFGDKIYVDIEICCDGSKTLYEAHSIAQNVHDAIEDTYKNVKHCMVHVNPQ